MEVQNIQATFDGMPCSSAEFTSVLGDSPGSGTISFADISYAIPKQGTLVL